ncbi:MAG: DUF1573 domain-containing protein [Haliscomenobacter sp.]|nr:DUF1573 domain-containing protein [Haliscomenobacter sp.]
MGFGIGYAEFFVAWMSGGHQSETSGPRRRNSHCRLIQQCGSDSQSCFGNLKVRIGQASGHDLLSGFAGGVWRSGGGVLVERQFEFTNAGKSPLVISRAYSTCGCTVPEWPEAPILPGEKGTLRVRFDTRGKVGEQYKPVYITANTLPATSKVYLIGEVIPGKK